MPPGKNILMDESFKTLLEIFIPVISSLLTAVIAWVLRGKYENKKMSLEMDKLALDLRKEEIEFRDRLMLQVRRLQEQVLQLEKTLHEQALQLEDLKQLVEEKDEQIKKLQNNEKLS